MRKATFSGTNVFLSRNLVAPEVYDAVHDALKLNGAEVFLCCDPSRNSPNDYHVISSNEHEKFEVLKSKGCNLLGPQCILSCAKEHRVLPKQGYTCCLAMDGVKVLASGFERDKKAIIGKLVTAMGGILQTKTSTDVNFVIVKDVLAAKYKHYVFKRPIVDLNWLLQCWTEHRVVPQEAFRVLPFTGLTICVTRLPLDERKEIQKLIVQNGGCYSADLTKKCTHLISDNAVGDKYTVAKKWGHILIVTRQWVDQCIARRGCVNEDPYNVDSIAKPCNGTKDLQKEQCDLELSNVSSQTAPRAAVADLEATLSENIASSFSDAQVINVEETNLPSGQMKDEPSYECRVAEDSETEDNDLYLSSCRIFLVGFEEKEQSRLVNMIRKGGGTRHMLLSEKLTHVILGAPSEDEKREVRRLAALGIIQVVRPCWLEECDRSKRELLVIPRHIASELLFAKEPSCNVADAKKRCSSFVPSMRSGMASDVTLAESLSENRTGREKLGTGTYDSGYAELTTKSEHSTQSSAMNIVSKKMGEAEPNVCATDIHISKTSDVFTEKSFSFSSSFPIEQRVEVIGWIQQGGGVLVDDQRTTDIDFIVELHGRHQSVSYTSESTVVSTHWIKSSLDDGRMLDIKSHIIYSPLRCRIPLPGFERLRFCISQYDEKERVLLKNLCDAVGARCSMKLSKKSTHLMCKFTSGPKYEAACKWGIISVTAEWIIECIMQDSMVPPDLFRPSPVTVEDMEAGLCTISQYPTQAANMVSGSVPSQLLSQSQGPMGNLKVAIGSLSGKRPRLPESNCDTDASKKKIAEKIRCGSSMVPDVADAIEDLLAQSNMIQDMKSPETSCCDQDLFITDRSSILGQNGANPPLTYGISRQWLNRSEKQDRIPHPVRHEGKIGAFDSFSETQTESQVVGYEEDLTGRQKIIDRVRSQNLTLTPDK